MHGRFNKYEAKKNITTSAHKANNAIKTHINITNEYSILCKYADLTKELLNKFLTTKDINEQMIIAEVMKLKDKVTQTNSNLKSDKKTFEGKVAAISNRMRAEVFRLSSQLDKIKEDSFLLENELLLKSAFINKIKKDKKNLNIIQEFERDIYITDPEKIQNFFSLENNICQEQLTNISKKLNIERLRITTLKNKLSELNKERTYSSILYTQPNICINFENNLEITPLITLENATNEELVDNENEELIFEDFSQSSRESKSEDDNITFPNKVIALSMNMNLNDNSTSMIMKTNPIGRIPNLKRVPMLDLKQIEFNKIKISQDTETLTNDDAIPTAKENIDHKIDKLKHEIKLLKKKGQKNKGKITAFNSFYAKMNLRYNNLQKKYLLIKEQNEKLQHNPLIKNEEKKYPPMINSIKIKKISK